MNRRNCIVGGIALTFGVVMVTLLVMDERWENHDTVKPIKSFLGGFLFIGLGAWYLFRGAKAEPWEHLGNILPRQNDLGKSSKVTHPDYKPALTELESHPLF